MSELKGILSYLPETISDAFRLMDAALLNRISEIRLRRGKAMVLVIKNTSYFPDYNGDIYEYPNSHSIIVSEPLFDTVFMELCSYSLYNNMDSLKNGYLTLENGVRVGVASTAVYDEGKLLSVKNITALNIRVPCAVTGCSSAVLNSLYINAFPSVLIAGSPNSGKTTFLRDMARQLAGGFNHCFRKVAVIDERNELAGAQHGQAVLDVGINTDVLTAFSKARGIEIATRTLSPEIIICDEVSTPQEVESILYGFSSGIRFALSVHIGERQDLYTKPIVKTLLAAREFSYIILLENYSYKPLIIEADEVYHEICRHDSVYAGVYPVGRSFM